MMVLRRGATIEHTHGDAIARVPVIIKHTQEQVTAQPQQKEVNGTSGAGPRGPIRGACKTLVAPAPAPPRDPG